MPESDASTQGSGAAAEPNGGIDVEALAERVYKLLLADARLGRQRSEVPLRGLLGAQRREE